MQNGTFLIINIYEKNRYRKNSCKRKKQLENLKKQYVLRKRSCEKTGFNSRTINSKLFHNKKNAQLNSLVIVFGIRKDIKIKISQVKNITGLKTMILLKN